MSDEGMTYRLEQELTGNPEGNTGWPVWRVGSSKFCLETLLGIWETPDSLDVYNLQLFWHRRKVSGRTFANESIF